MTVGAARLEAQSDLCLLLARAFLPPLPGRGHATMAALLPDDLMASAAAIPLEIGDDIRRFRADLGGIVDDDALLFIYSQLHLAPPVPAPLNAGLYLDGALQGSSVLAMEACYRRHGVERASAFRDLSDHLSVQLEFVALLLAEAAATDGGRARDLAGEAASFVEAFVRPWIPALADRMERAAAERGLPAPYRPLLNILMTALDALPSEPRHLDAPAAGRAATG